MSGVRSSEDPSCNQELELSSAFISRLISGSDDLRREGLRELLTLDEVTAQTILEEMQKVSTQSDSGGKLIPTLGY